MTADHSKKANSKAHTQTKNRTAHTLYESTPHTNEKKQALDAHIQGSEIVWEAVAAATVATAVATRLQGGGAHAWGSGGNVGVCGEDAGDGGSGGGSLFDRIIVRRKRASRWWHRRR